MTEPNIDLLDKTLHHIETLEAFKGDVDDEWEQAHWAIHVRDVEGNICGTSCCFAGWAVVLAGDKLIERQEKDGCRCAVCVELVAQTPDGHLWSIENRARDLLGLNFDQAQCLFEGGNDLDDLRAHVRAIKDGHELG